MNAKNNIGDDMTNEEYLRQRIKDLENAVLDSSLPMKMRKNQAAALLNYRLDLERELNKNSYSQYPQ